MFFIFIVCMIGSSVCAAVTGSVAQDSALTVERKTVAIAATSIGLALGCFLFQYAQFNIEFYSSMDIDFLDYGKITGEGLVYILTRVCSLVAVAENVLAIVNLFVQEIKQAIKEKQE